MSAFHEAHLSPRQIKHKKLAEELVEAVGGAKAAVDFSRAEKSQIYSYGSENTHSFMPSDVIEDLEAVARRPIVTAYLARRAGYVLVPLAMGEEDPEGLMASVAELTCELGDVAGAVRDALRDRIVTPAEREVVLEQLADLDRASATLRRKLQAMQQDEDRG